MKYLQQLSGVFLVLLFVQCGVPEKDNKTNTEDNRFPEKLVRFVPYKGNPIFSGTDTTTWDRLIRERGFILKEDSLYHMWYTGYAQKKNAVMQLGYATSTDGIHWERYAGNPIHTNKWVEDMFVIKHDGVYYMFAEGKDDVAHLMQSTDKIHWTEISDIDIRKVNGSPIDKGAYGTPTAWFENDTWYLFYEREDLGIWLATSKDMKIWTNIQDDPVIKMGPEGYDQYAVAMNQVIKQDGRYYGYYHGSAYKDWREWSTNVAVSKDLVHWEKYAGNPIMGDDTSSGILVPDGGSFRLYTMHDKVRLFLPVADSALNR